MVSGQCPQELDGDYRCTSSIELYLEKCLDRNQQGPALIVTELGIYETHRRADSRKIKPPLLESILKEQKKVQTTVSKTTVILSNEIKSAQQALMSVEES